MQGQSRSHSADEGDEREQVGEADFAHLGPLLDFAPAVEFRFDADSRTERVEHLRMTIPIGLLFYNVYNITDLFIVPDTILVGLPLRILCVTPVAVLLCWFVPRIPAVLRERLLLAAMVGAYAVPAFLFWFSSAPNATYTTPELDLVLVYGGMTLQLRFPHMLALTCFALAAACAGLMLKPELSPALKAALVVQAATGFVFVLYGSYRAELARRRAYLRELREVVRSDGLEADRTLLVGLSSTDPLTGLANRRALDGVLDASLRDARAAPVALLMIDVDHFKRFNDTYGHVAGDRCLREVARSLVPHVPGALSARYGGEEFAVVLPGLGRSAALAVAESLRSQVEALQIGHAARGDGIVVVTVSIGMAVAEAGGATPNAALVDAADAALYGAKTSGRNRCAAHEGSIEADRAQLAASAA